jgi:hypothetical protein
MQVFICFINSNICSGGNEATAREIDSGAFSGSEKKCKDEKMTFYFFTVSETHLRRENIEHYYVGIQKLEIRNPDIKSIKRKRLNKNQDQSK